MCGRFALFHSPDQWGLEPLQVHLPGWHPRYNIAPSQSIAVVHQGATGLEAHAMLWGFVPHWVREDKPRFQPINARIEGAASKPMFRDALAHHRCVIPASGFYEWQATEQAKQPWFARPKNNGVFLFAGLHSRWMGTGEPVDTVAILTRDAMGDMSAIHARMPVMLNPAQAKQWLGPQGAAMAEMLPQPEPMTLYPVNTRVNRPTNDDDGLIRPAKPVKENQ